ncbi:site-specific integrase [Empedobacter sp.]|uniref:site-specific integrase n=1 Tax=Empedobacter sp. TaxID=1927715 RepID=UPI0028B0CCA3|nr:site-specific integrase [Empedobacter sp.]
MITAVIIVDTRRITNKGYPIKIRVYNQEEKQNKYILTKKYQLEKDLVIDSEIRKLQYDIDERLIYCRRNNLDFDSCMDVLKNGVPDNDIDLEIKILESKLAELKKKRPSIGFIQFAEKFLNQKLKRNEKIEIFQTAINHLKKFILPDLDIPINNIDYDFVNNLDLYLRGVESVSSKNKKLSNATINTYFEKYNHIYNEAKKHEHLFVKDKNPFSLIDIKSISERTNKDYSLEELKAYFNSDLIFVNSKKYPVRPAAELAREIHKFQFLIGGHDLIDIASLKWSSIINNRLVFKRAKNVRHKFGGKTIDNMLHPLALEIIQKIGTKDNERIFSFLRDPTESYERYKAQRQYFDKVYKTIEDNFSFSSNKLRSKTMRYTFRTIAGNLMINEMMLKNIMGHSDNSISMGYQGATPYEIQDAEHLKVIEAVFGEKETP